MSAQEDVDEGYAMEVLVRDHYVALLVVNLGSLVLGLPLAWNTLWNLKVRYSNHNKQVCKHYQHTT